MRSTHSRSKKPEGGLSLRRSQGGYALIVALLANVILLALGVLAIHMATKDIRISARVVGDKKALAAAEAAIHQLTQVFDPANLGASVVSNVQVDSATDPNTTYTIFLPSKPTSGPGFVDIAGFSISVPNAYASEKFDVRVRGQNTAYGSSVEIDASVGFGPIDRSTMHR